MTDAADPTLWRRPPNQNLIRRAESWPVVGETASAPLDGPWTVTLDGRVADAQRWDLAALRAMPQIERRVDLHCVTRWTKLGCRFSGVPLMRLLDIAGPLDDAVSIRFVAHTERGHDTTLTLADIQRHDPLIALDYEGGPLPSDHGGPVRVVTPGKYFYKSCKWLARIELLSEHRLGYWESGPGYHDGADPWREERYITGSIPPDLRARMIEQRRFGGRDLLSCVFDGEDLTGLDATKATLRNTSFKGATLVEADFSDANLTNAALVDADLRHAKFHRTNISGADFSRADLSGADFSDAIFFGASFCNPDGGDGARFDAATTLDPAQLEGLADGQAAFVRDAIAKAKR